MNPVLAHIDSNIWAILPAELNKLRAAAASPESSQIVPKAARMAGGGGPRLLNYTTISQDIATINVSGILYNPEGFIDELIEFYFGGTSIPALISDIEAVSSDTSVKSVLFNFHSPGGDVFGINEAADKIAALSAKKKTVAYAYGLCCSAAYFLAAKCGEIVTDPQALLGSIGVVSAWYDLTGAYEQMGIAYEEVVSSNAPNKRLDIRKAADREVFMSEIDGIETVFLKSVARGRGVPLDRVKSDFGRGAVMAGHLAIKAGLADRLSSLADITKELSSQTTNAATASASAEGDMDMGFKEEFKAFAVKHGLMAGDAEPGEDESTESTTEEQTEESTTEESVETEAPETADDEGSDDAAAEPTAGGGESDTKDAAAQLAATRSQLIETKADAFVESEIKAGRMLPSEKNGFKSIFVQAANDDDASPLAEGTRTAALTTAQAARKPHGLTDEVIDADATQVLLASTGDRSDDEKKRDLMSKTPLGRAALTIVGSGKSATASAKK